MMRAGLLFLGSILAATAVAQLKLRPPMWTDPDTRHIPQPRVQRASEIYAIAYNSWFRRLSVFAPAEAAADSGAVNVNAWDEVPDSSWFINRIGRRCLGIKDIFATLHGSPASPGTWTVLRIDDEGYTPKLRIRDSAGRVYILKFDPSAPEKNSGAERIATLVLHAAGYNVPYNTIAYFRSSDLVIDGNAYYSDAAGKKRQLTRTDLETVLKKIKPRADGGYRGLASLFMPGKDAGKFRYTGTRKDDANDIIPHERRRELRGLRAIAAWINHADTGDKNTFDAYVTENGRSYLRHYLMDFGSTFGSGDYINGPYRVGHEFIFDGAAMGRSFITLGLWRRPWDVHGRIVCEEIGYYDSLLFEPKTWKPNYPNLAFERMDEADAYWGAKIVTAFSDVLLHDLAEAGEYSRREAASHLERMMAERRDAIGRYWFDAVSPLEDFAIDSGRLVFRDLGVERGYFSANTRRYQLKMDRDVERSERPAIPLPALQRPKGGEPDRHGRLPLAHYWVRAKRQDGGWSLPVEVAVGTQGESDRLEVLGWTHAARWPR